MTTFIGFIFDITIYALFAGIAQMTLLTIIAILMLPVLSIKGTLAYKRIMVPIMIFNLSLLMWGCFGNALWGALARDRLYIAGDPLIEFFPYVPFGPWAYDYEWAQQRGHLVGVSLSEARVLWALLASAVWTLSYLTYRKWTKVAA